MANTTYFNVGYAAVMRLLPDTDESAADIDLELQLQEYKVMRMVGLTAAPTNAIELSNLGYATVLLTAAQVESREPHSRGDGTYQEQKFSRALWAQEANGLIDQWRKSKYVKATEYQTTTIDSAWT